MKYTQYQIVFQEVPDEVSISFAITGCPLRCEGCHSPELQNPRNGRLLSPNVFKQILNKYQGMATCILFYGGEWDEISLIKLLDIAIELNYKTCLYTGREDVSSNIKKRLTYLKTGPYISSKGNLSSITTNQRFKNLKLNKDLTYLFQKRR